ncbi:Pentatricopeptide repeat [Dillenia turbinata]|uniref:Pentatricopeptide repeat n=1 Tax=Dillenia turbinata TaxID=194707 RepID=A0AAN8UZD9_9MAGN
MIMSSSASALSSSSFSSQFRVPPISHLSQSLFSLSSHQSHNTHQKLFFSSKPNSILELVLANEWSEEVENELKTSHPRLNHETVIYVLKKLDKDPEKASSFFNWVSEKTRFQPSSSIYSIMLRILGSKETMKQFWITLRKMKEQGFYLDEETYVTILGVFKKAKMASDAAALTHFYNRMLEENAVDEKVKSVVEVALRSEWSDEVEKHLGELKIVLSDNFVLRALKELRGCPSKALRFFNWAGQCKGFKHNTITYNAAARVLGQSDSIEEFWGIVEEMKTAGHDMDIDTYIKISRLFQKNYMLNDAVKLYEFMMDGPFKPSEQDCSLLLRKISSSNKPDLDLVFRVSKKYEASGNFLSKVVYDGIHRSLTSVGKFDEAGKIMEVMKNAGYEPDNITYSQLIFGLCKAGRFEEACKVLEEMEASGCVPDIKTWTILIQGYCRANEVSEAMICFAKMIEKNCEPDADLLDVLIDGLFKQKKLEGAYELLVQLVSNFRLRPWQATYKKLIERLLGTMKFEEALKLLRLMKKQNHPPFPDPFVQYISKFGSVEDAQEFLKALTVKEYPSSSAYLHIFESFFKEGRHSEAKDLLYKCPHHIRKHADICKLFGSAA